MRSVEPCFYVFAEAADNQSIFGMIPTQELTANGRTEPLPLLCEMTGARALDLPGARAGIRGRRGDSRLRR